MSGTMSSTDLVADLKASLHDAANVFVAASDADFVRMVDAAALDFNRVRPRVLQAAITLTAEVASYAAPADLIDFKSDTWSNGKQPQPWDVNYTGRLPRVRVIQDGITRKLLLTPAPTALQVSLFGSSFGFLYLAAHSVNATAANTTIAAGDRGLLILRAQAEAMREMVMRNVGKPVSRVDGGMGGTPRNGTPSHLYTVFMEEFERRAA